MLDGALRVYHPDPQVLSLAVSSLEAGVTMLKPIIEGILSGLMAAFLFTFGWSWYYVTAGWRWYLNKCKTHPQRGFFTWRYYVTVVMIFTIVYFFTLRKFGHM